MCALRDHAGLMMATLKSFHGILTMAGGGGGEAEIALRSSSELGKTVWGGCW